LPQHQTEEDDEDVRGEFRSSERKESRTNFLSSELSLTLDDSMRNEPVVELRVGPAGPNGILGGEVVGLRRKEEETQRRLFKLFLRGVMGSKLTVMRS